MIRVTGWVSRLHNLHESNRPFVSLIEFIRSKLSFLVAHVNGLIDQGSSPGRRKVMVDGRSSWRRWWPMGRSVQTHFSLTPYTWAEKIRNFERINSMRETNGNFDSCNSCKRLGTSRLHELHESKFPFVSRIEFIRSKLSNFSAHVSGVTVDIDGSPAVAVGPPIGVSPVTNVRDWQ